MYTVSILLVHLFFCYTENFCINGVEYTKPLGAFWGHFCLSKSRSKAFFALKVKTSKNTLKRNGFMNNTTQWQIPFFVKLSEAQFTEEVRALGFYCTAQRELVWQGGTANILLKPLRTNGGNLSSGYRFTYEGERLNDCLAVLQLILSMYPTSYVTGVECNMNGTEQNQIIGQAEKKQLKRGQMHGIYQNGRVGIVCMPDNTVLQVRKKGIRRNQLEQILKDIVETKDLLTNQTFDLFTAMAPEGELLFA